MSLRKVALLRSLPPLPPTSQRSSGGPSRRKNFSPLPWENYFDSSQEFTTSGNSSSSNIFRVYFRGQSGPVVFCLHGGGHSALSWALLAVSLTRLVDCRVVAMDIRGHGSTRTERDDELQSTTLVNDVLEVVNTVFPQDSIPPLVLVGHSMGGAIAVRVAARDVLPSLSGLVVLDVVEGSALESLSTMQSFLRGRPQRFNSLEKAIEWSVRSGQVRNVESARVAMAGQLTRRESSGETSSQTETVVAPAVQPLAVVQEEGEQDSAAGSQELADDKAGSGVEYVWRIDLAKTEPFWQGWFTGLSKLFLSTAVPKVLLLAGVDRLDKELSIGHMQGKFQLQVLSGCGHLIQEDVPDKVAETLASFLNRYKLAEASNDFERPPPAC